MTTRYRVEYALKHHRRDNFIEWIKGLLAVPFVLHSLPSTPLSSITREDTKNNTEDARRRYREILRDVEELINEDIARIAAGTKKKSKLKLLVPTIGHFFTPLPLEEAFMDVDDRVAISGRRNVPPSFNDVRFILAYAQLLQLGRDGVKLVTFDGDLTLYEDGFDLLPDSPIVERLVALLRLDIHVAILTAAGYSEKSGIRYKKRLQGLFDALSNENCGLTDDQKHNLHVLGGNNGPPGDR
ncbi:IMP-specific 5'-nucleotidase 1 [Neolecta irregularis DAH-3]|uniref:IMP-specific 5'-nucleotidase 1 n=1 Tax=Neolecta irregularis (strain DAH-3) TaxID=1198029 RepID=A0A1U7LV70_NEOID|nr:IMP-specific 5'-nucleotidase 1 [Neolecta irregularis DAH-3]|eukprot:OLL26576.1 IMP-specific 5'-nucleotidase 1 [Neolecta irregularis DAH-3]